MRVIYFYGMTPYMSLLFCWIFGLLVAVQPTYTAEPQPRNTRKPKPPLTPIITTTSEPDTEDEDYSSIGPTHQSDGAGDEDEVEDLFVGEDEDYAAELLTKVTDFIANVLDNATTSAPQTTSWSSLPVTSTPMTPTTLDLPEMLFKSKSISRQKAWSSSTTSSPDVSGLSFTDATEASTVGSNAAKETSSGLIPVSLRYDDHVEGSGAGPSYRTLKEDSRSGSSHLTDTEDDDEAGEPYEASFVERGSGHGPVDISDRSSDRSRSGEPHTEDISAGGDVHEPFEGSGATTPDIGYDPNNNRLDNNKPQVVISSTTAYPSSSSAAIITTPEHDPITYATPGLNNELQDIPTSTAPFEDPEDDPNHAGKDPNMVTAATNDTLLARPAMLAAVIGGAVVGLLCAILLVMYLLYRMRKKDEGSYALEEPTKRPGGYMRAPTNSSKEYYA